MKKSKNIVKIVYGIDISMEDFTVMSGLFYDNTEREVAGGKTFKNNQAGFERLFAYYQKQQNKYRAEDDIPVWFVMESTGIYYENLAYFLNDKGLNVNVALPNKIKNFIRTLEIKSKTDDLDARAITLYGLEKQISRWKAPDEKTKLLKELNRELVSARETSAAIKNQLHSKQRAYKTNQKTLKRIKKQINFYKNLIKDIESNIKTIVNEDNEYKTKIAKITRIKGVGLQTAVGVLSETNNFNSIENKRQLTSYAGLDIMENQSGKKEGRRRISKKGNSYLRKSLYMPALSAIKHENKMKSLNQRVCERNGWKNKKSGIVAVMRKLLHVIYALWKNDTEYNPNYGTV
jgi:transposase